MIPNARGFAVRLAATLAVALSALPSDALAQIVVGPELAVDAPIIAAGPRARSSPSVASDGTGFMVGFVGGGLPAFTWISPDGLSPDGPSTGLDRDASVGEAMAYDGTRFVAVWATGNAATSSLRVARIARDGRLLDSSPIHVRDLVADGIFCPAIASSGSSTLVSWTQSGTSTPGARIFAQRIGPDGQPSTTEPILVDTSQGGGCPSLASGGGQYLLAYGGDLGTDRVKAVRFDADGARIDATPITIGSGASSTGTSSIAFSSGQFLVAWLARTGSVAVARVRIDGSVVDTTPIILSPAGSQSVAPHVSTRADGWLVAWTLGQTTHPTVQFTRLDPSGAVLDASPLTLPGHSSSDLALGWDGTNNLIATSEASADARRIDAQRIDPLGNILDTTPLNVGHSAANEYGLALARSSNGALAAWIDDRDPAGPVIQIATLGADGTPTSATSRTLHSPAAQPHVASDGSGYLVSWVENTGNATAATGTSRLLAMRVAHDGTPLDAMPLVVSATSTGETPGLLLPRIYGYRLQHTLFDGTAYVLVAVLDTQDSNGRLSVFRVSPEGAVSEAVGLERVAPTGTQNAVPNPNVIDAATNGQNTLIAFGMGPFWGSSTAVGFVRARGDGSLYDPHPTVVATTRTVSHMTVATSGGDYLIAWTADGPTPGVHIARVTSDGVVIASGAETSVPGDRFIVLRAVGMGDGYLLSWQSGVAPGVMGARVARGGDILDPSGVAVADSIERPWPGAIAPSSGSDPGVLIGYARRDSTVLSSRAFVRQIGTTVSTPHSGGCGCRVDQMHRGSARSALGWGVVLVLVAARRRREHPSPTE